MFDEIVEKLSQMEHVRLIMLGGSRASGNADRQSDIDLVCLC
jgi:predicted nucleotidyltransferase